jgi:hypothetical protein
MTATKSGAASTGLPKELGGSGFRAAKKILAFRIRIGTPARICRVFWGETALIEP